MCVCKDIHLLAKHPCNILFGEQLEIVHWKTLTYIEKLWSSCISQSSPEKQIHYKCESIFIMGNCLMRLLRLRNPTICLLQAGDPGKTVVEFSPSLSSEGWRCKSWLEGSRTTISDALGRKMDVQAQAKGANSPSASFCSAEAPNRLDTPTVMEEGRLLYSVYWLKCQSLLETPSQTHIEISFTNSLGIL